MAGRITDAPLYDPAFDHDACGVGFVADAGGSQRERVLPLALAGLAALDHRGAFAADGESSDGAGIALPLELAVLDRISDGAASPGMGVVMLFLPSFPGHARRARRIVEESLAAEGIGVSRWRRVPVAPDVPGPEARASLPNIEQALVEPRTGRTAGRSLEVALVLARRRMEQLARAARLTGFSVPSASARTVVYKGLVAGARIADFYPDLAAPLPVSYAVFHQRYATNTHPRWSLAQPFRLVAHNGEINTVRGNREQVRGRAAALGGRAGRRLRAVGPLLAPGASDSLSFDEMAELLVASGWDLPAALMALVPEALALRATPHHAVHELQRRAAALVSPWDGPAALVFSDGRRVGALLDRNGLRPAAYAVTHDRLVALASEAGAVPLDPAEIEHRARLGPGEMILVDPRLGSVLEDDEAKTEALRRHSRRWSARSRPGWTRPGVQPVKRDPCDGAEAPVPAPLPLDARYVAGLNAERLRLSIRTMALEGREPLWSMGDDTPTPALARRERPVTDHLRQSFAQVTNPPIDPDRERIVMEMSVEVGRRPPLLGGIPHEPLGVRLPHPFLDEVALRTLVADLEERRSVAGRRRRTVQTLDSTWPGASGPHALERALTRLSRSALSAARGGVEVVVLSDRGFTGSVLPIPSVLAVGAVHTALTDAGLRGRTDVVVDAADIHDVHAAAMALAAGASAVSPWAALELAAELAGGRGAETLTPADARRNVIAALERGLRKILARMGISCAASYIGGQFFEVLELHADVVARCFPHAPAWPGNLAFRDIGERQLRRLDEASKLRDGRLPDPGLARYRADGEVHLYAPPVVRAIQAIAGHADAPAAGGDGDARRGGTERDRQGGNGLGRHDAAGSDVRAIATTLTRPPSVIRDQLAFRKRRPVPLDEVEPVEAVVRRFVSAAMSLGSLSPEAHQALTIAMRRLGAASNTGEGGEDPEWYLYRGDIRRDAAIKQVASARFGVTATYLARAEQLEIKIAQGSKPGEGGQLPGTKATAEIAALRRGRPGQSMISPPPHHDIYSIEDLAQLIADLRAISPVARIGVKLVAAVGIGTIAAGVAKAGADYIQVSGHAGGTGASPLSSIKHAGIPWELGLAETHQVLIANDLRTRVALRADGGLQTGRDVVVAALLGAEEFGFGTAALVALGCDMARQCHLDTCPTGIATQRTDLRARFTGTPDAVERFFRALADEVRLTLASLGLRSIGQAVGRVDLLRAVPMPTTLDLSPLLRAPVWDAVDARRTDPATAAGVVARAPASEAEERLVAALSGAGSAPHPRPAEHGEGDAPDPIPITTADRAFGARATGALERGEIARAVDWTVRGSAGQSFGAFLGRGMRLVLEGEANDYVGKGLSGGTIVVRPEVTPVTAAGRRGSALAGNTCLYGATSGRLHVIGRAGMRFAVRNSGAEAVAEGIGPHGCEYMTGGVVVILGPAGTNLCAGMTGGRVYVVDREGGAVPSFDTASVRCTGLADVLRERDDGADRWAELHGLLVDHRDAGSAVAAELLETPERLAEGVWLLEALEDPRPATPPGEAETPTLGRDDAARRRRSRTSEILPGARS